MKVGVGIVTYNRPDYLKQCIAGVKKNLLDVADVILLYNDGSNKGFKEYQSIYKTLPEKIVYKHAKKNKGVATAKNWLLKKMYDAGCDYMFILEDDIVIDSPKAVTEYIKKSDESGIEHFQFVHHGDANKRKKVMTTKGVDLYRNPVGAWCLYTKKVLEVVGLFDPVYMNAWEHVEHSWLIANAGYTPPWGASVCDLSNSKKYMHEIPGSIDNSSIRPRKDFLANSINGLIRWKQKYPRQFPLEHILSGLLKEEAREYDKLGIKNPRYE
jgi:GT2 family glycosyltransferase